MPTDWKSLAKETIHSFDADEVRGMWDVDFRRATRVFLADHEDEIAAERRGGRGPLRKTNAVVFGLAKRLAPPRRLVFALVLAPHDPRLPRELWSATRSPQASGLLRALRVGPRARLPARDGARRQAALQGRARHGARPSGAARAARPSGDRGVRARGVQPHREHGRGRPLRIRAAPGRAPRGPLRRRLGPRDGRGARHGGHARGLPHAASRRSVARRDDRVAEPRPLRDRERPLVLRRRLRAPRAGRRRDGDRRGPSARPQGGRGRARRPAPRHGLVSSRHQEERRVPARDHAFSRPARCSSSIPTALPRRAARAARSSATRASSAFSSGGRERGPTRWSPLSSRTSTSSWAGSPRTTTSRSRRSGARPRERIRGAPFAAPGAAPRRGGRAPVVDGRARDQARPAAGARRRLLAVVRVGDLPRSSSSARRARAGGTRRRPRSLVYALMILTFVSATKMTTAANAIFLQYTGPLYVLALAPFLLKERVSEGATRPPSASRSPGCRSSSSAGSTPARSRGTSSRSLSGVFFGLTILLLRRDAVGRRDSVRHRGQSSRGGARAAVRVGPPRARRARDPPRPLSRHRPDGRSATSSSCAA